MSGGIIGPMLLSIGLVVAQDTYPPDEWRDVQAITPGTQIKLVMKAGDVEGTFVAANDEVLVIHLKKSNFSVDRPSVKRIDQRLPGSNRVKNVNRGAAWGTVAGLLRSKFACGGCSGFGTALITSQSMLIGTVVGATASAAKWQTVYRK